MIDKKTIEHIAKLSRLDLSGPQAEQYSRELTKIMDYFEVLSRIDTQGIEPLITPTSIEPHWREDVAQSEFTSEEMLENAPDKVGNLLKVPPVV